MAKASRPQPRTNQRTKTAKPLSRVPLEVAIAVVLFVAVLLVYSPVLHFEFVNYDDPDYVTGNPVVAAGLSWAGMKWAFTSTYAANWFPVTWLSHMLDVQWFGMWSGWRHLVNVVLHAAASILVFLTFRRMTRSAWPSGLVAFLFALHPLRVESVAWIAERKDVLSAFFWFLTLYLYSRYVEHPGVRAYALVLAAFCLGLMSKPMAVTLPIAMLLLDVWPLKRVSRAAFVEKIPLFALSAVASAATYVIQQRGGAVQSTGSIPFASRIANAVVSYAVYLWQMMWPARLAVFYPYPSVISPAQIVSCTIVLAGITAYALWSFRRRPYIAAGWFWYIVTLLPVIGLVQVGEQSHADRYTYIPSVGIAIIVAWAMQQAVTARPAAARMLATASAAICVLFACATWFQLQNWRDSETLFRHAIAVTDNNYVAYTNLGAALRKSGNTAAAISAYEKALNIRPGYIDAQNDLGEALIATGHPAEAIPHIEAALHRKPDMAEAHVNLGEALDKLGRTNEAILQYREAIRLQPGRPEAYAGLGLALADAGRIDEAVAQFRQAIKLDPQYSPAHFDLGKLFGQIGRHDEAAAEFAEVVRLNPADPQAHMNLGIALAGQQKFNDAITEFSTAVRLKPDYANAYMNLGAALANAGRLDEAIEQFSQALRIDPTLEQARQSRDAALALARDFGGNVH